MLTSPPMDLRNMEGPTLRFDLWYFNDGGATSPNDTFNIYLINKSEVVLVEQLLASTNGWEEREIAVLDFLQELDSVQISFETGDVAGSGHLVEGGVDAFEAFDALASSTNTPLNDQIALSLAPNPFQQQTQLRYTLQQNNTTNAQLAIYNYLGQQLELIPLSRNEGSIDIGHQLPAGIYFLQIQQAGKVSQSLKMIKQ
ncbi:MAG: T9SS type A sorting domain-containing protein [Bacteroidota bacterium]